MSAQKFKYFIPKEESTAIHVSKDTRNAIKFFAKTGGMTMVAATYFVIREGFTYLQATDEARKRELIKKIMRLSQIA
ncbi:hypothetical protein ACFLYR_06465 [Chloroflexota bacterium]